MSNSSTLEDIQRALNDAHAENCFTEPWAQSALRSVAWAVYHEQSSQVRWEKVRSMYRAAGDQFLTGLAQEHTIDKDDHKTKANDMLRALMNHVLNRWQVAGDKCAEGSGADSGAPFAGGESQNVKYTARRSWNLQSAFAQIPAAPPSLDTSMTPPSSLDKAVLSPAELLRVRAGRPLSWRFTSHFTQFFQPKTIPVGPATPGESLANPADGGEKETITFDEAKKGAFGGMKVIHPDDLRSNPDYMVLYECALHCIEADQGLSPVRKDELRTYLSFVWRMNAEHPIHVAVVNRVTRFYAGHKERGDFLEPGDECALSLLLDHHQWYIRLLRVILLHESRLEAAQRHAPEDLQLQPPSGNASWILNAYAERFGLGKYYRHLVLLKVLVKYFDHRVMHLGTIGNTLTQLAFITDQERVMPKMEEVQLYSQTLATLHDHIKYRLGHYRDLFVNNKPRGALAALIQLHELLLRMHASELKLENATSSRHVLYSYIEAQCRHRFDKLCPYTDAGDLNAADILVVAQLIARDIADDALVFRHTFPTIEEGERVLSLPSVSARVYYQRLGSVVEKYISRLGTGTAKQQGLAGDSDAFAVSAMLYRLSPKFSEFIEREKERPLYKLFNPILLGWLERLSSKVHEWVTEACNLDRWQPLSNETEAARLGDQHYLSSSVVDIFSALHQSFDLLKTHSYLNDGPNDCAAIASFSGMLALAVDTYSTIVHQSVAKEIPMDHEVEDPTESKMTKSEKHRTGLLKKFRRKVMGKGKPRKRVERSDSSDSAHKRAPSDIGAFNESVINHVAQSQYKQYSRHRSSSADAAQSRNMSVEICIRMNNIEMARRCIHDLATEMESHYTGDTEEEEGANGSTKQVDTIAACLQPIFPSLKFTVVSLVHMSCSWLNLQILDDLYTGLEKCAQHPENKVATPPSHIPGSVVDEVFAPLLDHLDTQLGLMFSHLLPAVMSRCLRCLWDLLTRDMEQVLFGSKRMAALSQYQAAVLHSALEPIRQFFYADGAGIKRKYLDDSTSGLERYLELYSIPTQVLVDLFNTLRKIGDVSSSHNVSKDPSVPAPPTVLRMSLFVKDLDIGDGRLRGYSEAEEPPAVSTSQTEPDHHDSGVLSADHVLYVLRHRAQSVKDKVAKNLVASVDRGK